MIDDVELRMMQCIAQSQDVKNFCKSECPFGDCYSEDKNPLKCWLIQRVFDLPLNLE